MVCSCLHPKDLVKVEWMLIEECVWNGALDIQRASLFCTSCPLTPPADHLVRWEQPQENTSLGLADNVCLSVPYLLSNAWRKWRAVKMHYVLCSCKDMCPPVVLLIGKPGPWGAVLCTGEHCCKKTQYTNIQSKTTVGSLMQ